MCDKQLYAEYECPTAADENLSLKRIESLSNFQTELFETAALYEEFFLTATVVNGNLRLGLWSEPGVDGAMAYESMADDLETFAEEHGIEIVRTYCAEFPSSEALIEDILEAEDADEPEDDEPEDETEPVPAPQSEPEDEPEPVQEPRIRAARRPPAPVVPVRKPPKTRILGKKKLAASKAKDNDIEIFDFDEE